MLIDTYSKYHDKLDIAKVVPGVAPLIPRREVDTGVSRVRSHIRRKVYKVYDLFKGDFREHKQYLPGGFKTIMEISCRAAECPYPFNFDPVSGGICYGCIYCFSKYTESSMYTSWFDGYDIRVPRFAHIEHVQDTMQEILAHRSIRDPYERSDKKTAYCGAVTNNKALQKCAAMGLPLRFGNRAEPFLRQERRKMVTHEALKIVKDFDYPFVINTKGTVLAEEPWFSLITDMEGKAVIMVSIISNDEDVAKRLEPHAPSPEERWDVIKKFNEVGVRAMPRMEPIMAFINDSDEHMKAYAEKAKECGVTDTLLDSYSYTVKSQPIRQMFYNAGFDFDRMFWATSEFTILGSYLIQKMMYYFKQQGIRATTFDFNSIPYADDPTCCGIGEFFGTWNKYNLWTAVQEMFRDKKSLSFEEFDDQYYGHELHPSIRQRVKEVWNCEKQDCWVPDSAEGIRNAGISPEGNIIYTFDENEVGQGFDALVAMYGGE